MNPFRKSPGSALRKAVLVLFGVLLALLLVEALFRAAGGLMTAAGKAKGRHNGPGNIYRILCLGESTTQGEWPPFLEEELNRRGTDVAFEVIDKGVRGASTVTVLARLEKLLDAHRPHMVVAMLGINDGEWIWKDPVPFEDKAAVKRRLFLKGLRLHKLYVYIADGLRKRFADKGKRDFLRALEPPSSEAATTRGAVDAGNKAEALIERGSHFHKGGELDKAEESYRDAVRTDRRSLHAYSVLGNFYREQKDFDKAEWTFRECLRINGGSTWLFNDLGDLYRETAETEKAAEMYKAAIRIDPRDLRAYLNLADLYLVSGDFEKAREIFETEPRGGPRNARFYTALGDAYREKGELEKAESLYEAALKIDPRDPRTLLLIGKLSADRGEYEKAESMFRKAIESDPKNPWIHDDLKAFYKQSNDPEKAEKMYEAAIRENPKNPQAYIELSYLYRAGGKNEKAEEVLSRGYEAIGDVPRMKGALSVLYLERGKDGPYGTERRAAFPPPAAVSNYRRLKDIILKRGITLVCMQYPLRDIEPLKQMLGTDQGIVFVENKKNFEEAVKSRKLSDIFVDMFAGDFGHCTAAGNRLIAENLAETILEHIKRQGG